MTTELLSCPFCGGGDVEPRGSFHMLWGMRCNDCNVRTQGFTSKEEAIAAWNRRDAPSPVGGSADLPPPELTWLYTHCRAIGMDCKSESGKWEHDIALFTINMKDQIAALARPVVEGGSADLTDWIGGVIQDVSELPDRDSPSDWPDAMLVTGDELREIIQRRDIASRPAALAAPTDAARDVLAERRRQVEAEGWTPEHDDKHGDGQMARAAACYAFNAGVWAENGYSMDKHNYALLAIPGYRWPWAAEWWKPKSPRQDLVRASALILAEIERIDRAALAADPLPVQKGEGNAAD